MSLFRFVGLVVLVPALAVAADVPRLVPVVEPLVQAEVARDLVEAEKVTRQALQRPAQIAAHFKMPLVAEGLPRPWQGLAKLEDLGGKLAGDLDRVPTLLDRLAALHGWPAGEENLATRPDLATLKTPADHAAYLVAVLDRARDQRDAAVARLTKAEVETLFEHVPDLLSRFGPQESLTPDTKAGLAADLAFCRLAAEKVDWGKLLTAYRTLHALTDPAYLDAVRKLKDAPGADGLLLKKETPHGLVVLAGPGKNRHAFAEPVAVLIDLGGDDTYTSAVGASRKANPLAVAIDLGGNDTYDAPGLRLATGRGGGIGLVLDVGGDDVYKLSLGAGGCGFGGVGVLIDRAGDDTYTGSTYTQGAALGGLGLLIDLDGKDRYTSHGFALGFGGPVGAGVVLDAKGDDRYQCGNAIPSGYNASDAPNAKPGDANFQWDAFGLGMGLGRRVWPPTDEGVSFALAGGLGAVIDLAGDDAYTSSNFSQGCGYFFGAGLLLDYRGSDTYAAARYGHACGAHYGFGLAIDYAGRDRYKPAGPTYNLGCAWDHSVFLAVDGGDDADDYDLTATSGLGRGDIGGWGVFVEMGGDDTYRGARPGGASDRGLAVFLDRAGKDDYAKVGGEPKLGDGVRAADGKGGLFVDRPGGGK